MIKDMTKGSPLELLITFTLPILVGSMLQQCYYLVDGIIIGQFIGVNALAAIGAVTYIDGLMIGFGMSMIQGFGILIAQRFGAKEDKRLRQTIVNSVYITIAVAIVMTVISLLIIQPFLRLLNIPLEIMDQARRYISIIIGFMIVPMLSNLAFSIMRAMGDSKAQLIFLIMTSLVNMGLDILLVVVFHMGVVGTALGTILAQIVGWPFLIHRLRRIETLQVKRIDWNPHINIMLPLLKLGLPMAIQNSIALVGIIVLQIVVNGFNVLHIAAFATAMRIFFFVKEPSVAFSHAISTYVGQNYGAGLYHRVKIGMRKALFFMLSICSVAMTILIVFNKHILGLVLASSEAETIRLAQSLLLIFAIALPSLYLMFIYRSALQGMGITIVPMISGGIEMVMRAGLALTLPNTIGFIGAALAEVGAWIFAAIPMIIVYHFKMRKVNT